MYVSILNLEALVFMSPRGFLRQSKTKELGKKDVADRKKSKRKQMKFTNSVWPAHLQVVVPIFYMIGDLVYGTFLWSSLPPCILLLLPPQISNIFLP